MARTPTTEFEITTLLEQHHLLSAVDIMEKLALLKKSVNKTTVYRTLDKLLAKGTICRHSLGSDTLYYELRNDHHDHAVCESCGDVLVIECHDHMRNIKTSRDFTPLHHHVTVFGLCGNCST